VASGDQLARQALQEVERGQGFRAGVDFVNLHFEIKVFSRFLLFLFLNQEQYVNTQILHNYLLDETAM
jgi:hypothetical protein